ncbi:MAG: hypothetical protein V4671_32695 [Armatimonadota bacterium]
MNTLRTPVMKTLGLPVIFKVNHLKTDAGWAFVLAQTMDADMPSAKSVEGRLYGLLSKREGRWQVLKWGASTDSGEVRECKDSYPGALAVFP